jgi:hypothetical protein
MFSKKKDGYYLVSVNGKKGWVAESDVRPLELTVKADAEAEPPAKAPPKEEKLPPGTLVSPDGRLRVTLGPDGSVSTTDKKTGGAWKFMPSNPGKGSLQVVFAPKGSKAAATYGPALYVASRKVLFCLSPDGELLWKTVIPNPGNVAVQLASAAEGLVVNVAEKTQRYDFLTGKRLE